ncbi:MAG TPA: signal peptidase II [Candidatus Limnocylindria bacterium]|nr:signal peptidase II [Candidatus Limnocylindria bacterium]
MEARSAQAASMRSTLVLVSTAAVVYALDQLSKALVVSSLGLGESVDVVGDLLRIWHARNTGAAFSLLPGAFWLFVPVTVLALVMIAYFHRAFRDRGPWIHVVLGLILGGSLGNLTDRLRLGYVVDFVSVGIGDRRFPTFNVADSAVVVGIGLLVLYLTLADRRGSSGDAEA